METSECPSDCHKNSCGWNHPEEEQTQCLPEVLQAETNVAQALSPGPVRQKAKKKNRARTDHSDGLAPAEERNGSPFREHDTPDYEHDL
jgi:hypothetical protein